jgi:hypothetical protein
MEVKKKMGALTERAAAAYLGLSADTLARYRLAGTGPRCAKYGRGKTAPVRYRLEDLAAWYEERIYKPPTG